MSETYEQLLPIEDLPAATFEPVWDTDIEVPAMFEPVSDTDMELLSLSLCNTTRWHINFTAFGSTITKSSA